MAKFRLFKSIKLPIVSIGSSKYINQETRFIKALTEEGSGARYSGVMYRSATFEIMLLRI